MPKDATDRDLIAAAAAVQCPRWHRQPGAHQGRHAEASTAGRTWNAEAEVVGHEARCLGAAGDALQVGPRGATDCARPLDVHTARRNLRARHAQPWWACDRPSESASARMGPSWGLVQVV